MSDEVARMLTSCAFIFLLWIGFCVLQCEAIPESLKNMLLVMHTAGILQNGNADDSQLWKLTWDRIDTFLPNLREEVFKPHEIC